MLKKILFSTFLIALTFTSLLSPNAEAAKFLSGDEKNQDVKIEATNENVYAAGQNVIANQNVAKDLILAGGKIEVNAIVGRSIIAAGGEVNINSKRVSGPVRVAGNKVVIKGNFSEEVMVAAEEVVIQDARIQGDLIIATNKLTIENSNIIGNAKISYSEGKGDFNSQIKGDKQIQKVEVSDSRMAYIWDVLATQLSVIVFLLVAYFSLKNRNALELTDIKFNSKFFINALIGLGIIVLTLPVLVITLFAQLYNLTIPLAIIIYLSFILTSFYFPIYLANLLKNQFNLSWKFKYIIIASYLLVSILSVIPVINAISYLIFFILLASNFGYLIRKLFSTIKGEKNVENKVKVDPKDALSENVVVDRKEEKKDIEGSKEVEIKETKKITTEKKEITDSKEPKTNEVIESETVDKDFK